jgi:hypothetical protein
MSDSEAKLHLSLKEGVFEISGPEHFVSQQIENFKEIILETLQNRRIKSDIVNVGMVPPDPQGTKLPPLDQQNLITKYFPRVLHIQEKDVKIIKKMPGANNSKKTINTALAYLWGKKSIGIEEVSFQEIRDLCEQQGCLDTKNFAAHMKGAREYIIVDGKKGSTAKTCKLTLPGMERAEEILEGLNGE